MTNKVVTMNFNNSNKRETSPFIRQESKYYDDMDEDGGFESFQVADDSTYEDEGSEDHLSSGRPQSTSPDSGLSVVHRDRTFAQSLQNIPETELKGKASSVLDLINAEISDLHMREMELKHKTVGEEQKEINDESEDLAEGSSQADSDDYPDSAVDIGSYSPTSNSPGNLTPADSRNRGGSPYSPNSDHDSSRDKLEDLVDGADGHGGRGGTLEVMSSSKTASAIGTEDESGSVISGSKHQVGVKVRPIVEEEVKSIELNMTKETPIEREIRLVGEREEEFRRHRSLTTAISIDKDEQLRQERRQPSLTTSSASLTSSGHPGPIKSLKTIPTDTAAEPQSAQRSPSAISNSGGHGGSPKDIQYEMATARLKREIEESLMRERELYREGRVKNISVSESADENNDGESNSTVEGSENGSSEDQQSSEKSEDKVVEDHNILPSAGRRALTRLSMPTVAAKSDEVNPTINNNNSNSSSASPAVRFFTPIAYTSSNASAAASNGISPVISPITTPGAPSFPTNAPKRASLTTSAINSPTNSTPLLGQKPQQSQSLPMNIAKPQFTSIERMILKGSFSFNKNLSQESNGMMMQEEQSRLSKSSRMPDPLQIVFRTESIEETEEGENVEADKPRRKYVPAQDKIQLELKEQNNRENELSQLRAKWKSTPDLSKSTEEESENCMNSDDLVTEKSQEAESLTKPSYLRKQRSSSSQRISEIPVDEVSTSDVLRMNKPTVRRRQSALINQWEEMIKQQQQKNKN